MGKTFTQGELEAIPQVLADTSDGLTGSKIGRILTTDTCINMSYVPVTVTGFASVFSREGARTIAELGHLGLQNLLKGFLHQQLHEIPVFRDPGL